MKDKFTGPSNVGIKLEDKIFSFWIASTQFFDLVPGERYLGFNSGEGEDSNGNVGSVVYFMQSNVEITESEWLGIQMTVDLKRPGSYVVDVISASDEEVTLHYPFTAGGDRTFRHYEGISVLSEVGEARQIH